MTVNIILFFISVGFTYSNIKSLKKISEMPSNNMGWAILSSFVIAITAPLVIEVMKKMLRI